MEKQFVLKDGRLQTPCWITEPEDTPISRVVLGVHGLSGSSMDTIQVNLAEEMSFFSAAVVRFDFPGHGQNPDRKLDAFTCVETLQSVVSHIRTAYPQAEDLCIFATGFGAYITLLSLPVLDQRIKLVLQTPSIMMHETLLAMTGWSQQTFRGMEKMVFPTNPPLEVTYQLYRQMQENPVLNTYHIPMLILHCERDDYIPMEHVQNFRRINELSKLVIIPGATHRFQEPGAWDMVLDLTRDWFDFEQVLLTDCI